jgi:uncharacterized membrane protein
MQTKSTQIFKQQISGARKIAICGLVMAIYIVLMYYTQGFAFGQYQIRIATSLYGLVALHPFLMVPLALSNLLSNMLLGGLGIYDTLGGFMVGIVTTSVVYLIRRFKLNDLFIAVPIIFGPGLIVPVWLSNILNVPYNVLALSLCIGQIVPSILGVILVKQLRNKI